MKNFDADISRENILKLYYRSGLTLEEFANILGISNRWLKYIISGTYNFEINVISKVCAFFGVDFTKLTTINMEPPINIRENLIKLHAKNTEYITILSAPPSIPYIIEIKLLEDSEFKNSLGMELKEIKKIIKKHYPTIKLSNLSADLQKSDFIRFSKHPSKKNTNLYKKK